MSELKFRPRFQIETSLSENKVEEIVKKKLSENNSKSFESTIAGTHLILKIPSKDQHFWSPQMDISLSQLANKKGTLIRCLLAPKPAVWTMFMFLYSAAGFGVFIGLMVVMSQWTLGREMWAWYIVGLSSFVGLILFFVAQIGKGIAKEQMIELKKFITDIEWP